MRTKVTNNSLIDLLDPYAALVEPNAECMADRR